MREADKDKDEVWKMEDEVSDEELAAKVGELFDMAPKVRKNLSKAAGEAQVAKQMEMGQAHL